MFVELDPGIEFMLSVTIWAGLFHGCVNVKKTLTVTLFSWQFLDKNRVGNPVKNLEWWITTVVVP